MRVTHLVWALVCIGCSSEERAPDVSDPCTDSEASVFGELGSGGGENGAILKCARGASIPREELEGRARANGYRGKPFVSGARTLTVAYRTASAHHTAVVLMPDTPRIGAPLAVAPHAADERDFDNLTLPVVGAGIPVIAPAYAADAEKRVLDATHAFRRLVPTFEHDKFVLLGESIGGHAALSTLAASASYPPSAKLAAVVAFAPLFVANEPVDLAGDAARVPILFLYGGRDGELSPERVSCVAERLTADGAAVTYCVEPMQDHSTILATRESYAIDWLLVRSMGGAEPPPCEHGEGALGTACDIASE